MPRLGALGSFTRGRATPDDEGDLRLAITADRNAGIVCIDFGKQLSWFGMERDQAERFAMMILARAREL